MLFCLPIYPLAFVPARSLQLLALTPVTPVMAVVHDDLDTFDIPLWFTLGLHDMRKISNNIVEYCDDDVTCEKQTNIVSKSVHSYNVFLLSVHC